MYRSRLGNDLNETTLDYVSSISDDIPIAIYDILGSEAHTIMLYRQEIITIQDAKKILISLEKLKQEKFTGKYDAEDIHELIESLVIKDAGMDSGGKMHTARSRNDQVSLDIKMKIRDDINILCGVLLDAIEALVSLAQNNTKTIMPLYTHLQQAQVGTFSHYLLAHADALFRDLDRLYTTYDTVNSSPLGAGPVGGTSIPISREITARLLGFDDILENSIDATSSRDYVAQYISAVSILMTNLSKMAEDFVLWSTTEFSFIELSDEFTSPSSVMPQKKNPDILELTRGKTSEVIGYLVSILSTVKGLATGYGRDLQQIKSPIWKTSKISTSALIIIKSMLLTLTINEKNMKKAASASYLIALDIAEKLVQKGIPFRTTHKIAGKLVASAHLLQKPLQKLPDEQIQNAIADTAVNFDDICNIIQSTTLVSSLKDRKSQGSSGFSEQKRMIKSRTRKINSYRTKITKRDNDVTISLNHLHDEVKKIIS